MRTWPGAHKSHHAPHPIAAVGRGAEDLCARFNRSDFSFDSPFARLLELDARVLLIGVGFHVCTFIHLLEERVEAPYREWVELTGTVVEDGVATRKSYPFFLVSAETREKAQPYLPRVGEWLERDIDA